MYEELAKIASIFFLTMFKFIAGPALGYAAGFSFLGSVAITVAGMMASVILFTFLGEFLREKLLARFFKNRKKFTPRNRRFVKIWKKYGLNGVAFLTPLILTPIGGTLVLANFGAPKGNVLVAMLLSAMFWALFFCGIIYYFGTKVLPSFMQMG